MLRSFKRRHPAPDRAVSGDGSEEALVKSFIQGDSSAFSELYRRHYARVMSQISNHVRDSASVDDLAQEVFLKAHRFRSTYQLGNPFGAWIKAITRNTVFDWLRRQGSDRVESAPSPLIEEMASDVPGAEALVIRKSERKRLWRVMRSLTKLQRRVLWLSLVHQLPYQEIARRLGVSIASVKCLAYRARAALAEDLGPALAPA